jgi:hypothetical protein
MIDKKNIPVFNNPADIVKFSEKLRDKNNGKLVEALIIYEAERLKILYKMKLNEKGFELIFEEDLIPKKRMKYIKNKETGKMELDFF